MNELQVKTIEFIPAKVEFNFEELSEILDEQLEKYKGLTFTEKEAAECKKTIAELNKGKRALNDYRIKTKKELTKSITEFENQCKELSVKFDSVIEPLKMQYGEFENKRKEEKLEKIQTIIDELVEKEGLNEKYATELKDLPKEYFNKSKTLKSIQEELTVKAEHLGILQDKEEADQELIKTHVQLVNAKYNVNLPDSVYLNLLGFKTIKDIKLQIEEDAKAETKKEKEIIVTRENKELFIEVYEVTGTEEQLDKLEEYMSSIGITWNVIEE